MNIGIIGMGNMGRAIAERLIDTKSTVMVWNRTREKCTGLESATIAETPAELAEKSDIVLSVLGNDDALKAVYEGTTGICSVDLSGTTVVEFCTTSPDRAKSLESIVNSAKGLFLECPVGGTIGPARNGELLGLAGGSIEAFETAKPVLQKLTRRLEHLGSVGSAAAMKLAINLPLMVYWSSLGEALSIAIEGGIDTELAFDILADSSGAIGAAKIRLPLIRDYLTKNVTPTTNFSLENATKDMKLMEMLIASHGQKSPVISAVRTIAEEAADSGYGQHDASLVSLYEKAKPPNK